MRNLILILVMVSVCFGANWKFCGNSPTKIPTKIKGAQVCFYDEESVRYLDNGNIQVWVEIDVISQKKITKAEIDSEARIIASGYIPPHCLIHNLLDKEHVISTVDVEYAKNHDESNLLMRFLYEYSADGRRIKILSSYSQVTGRSSEDYDWDYVAPQTLSENIYNLVKQ